MICATAKVNGIEEIMRRLFGYYCWNVFVRKKRKQIPRVMLSISNKSSEKRDTKPNSFQFHFISTCFIFRFYSESSVDSRSSYQSVEIHNQSQRGFPVASSKIKKSSDKKIKLKKYKQKLFDGDAWYFLKIS